MNSPREKSEERLVNLVQRGNEKFDLLAFDNEFINKAYEYSNDSSRSVRSIIDDLARYCYDDGKLLGNEVMEKLREYDIAGMLVRSFIDNLPDRNNDVCCDIDPGYIIARRKLLCFLHGYARDRTETAHAFVKKKKKLFPKVNFYQLFQEPEIRQLFHKQVNLAARADIVQKYKNLYEGEPEAEKKKEEPGTGCKEEDPEVETGKEKPECSVDESKGDMKERHRENFITDILFNRVFIPGPNGKFDVDTNALRNLLNFIDRPEPGQPGFELEKLYMLVYKEFKMMADIRKQTRESVSNCLGELISSAQYPFLEMDFEFDRFFHRHFTPIIKEIRAEKLPKKDIELVDVVRTDPTGMAQVIMPGITRKPLLEFSEEMTASKEDYMTQLRRYFQYVDTAETRISDDEVMKLVSDHLKMAKRQIKYTIKEALRRRERRDPIRLDCQFIPEIIECTDPKNLLGWLADPSSFGREFPEWADMPYKIVAHQAKVMLELMLFYRKHIFDNRYKVAARNRKSLESHFSAKDTLNLRGKESKIVTFRIKMLVDQDQQPIIKKGKDGELGPVYKVIYLDENPPADGKNINYMHPNRAIIVNEDGGSYKLFPVEKKKFQRVTASIPDGGENKHECELLVYSGDGNLIHVKSEESFLSSILRGNEPSDICRWLVVTGKQEDGIALSKYLNKNYSDYIKIKDNRSKRNLGGKKSRKRVEGAKSFQDNLGYKSSMYAMLPKRIGKKIDHSRINFETQIFDDLDGMITQNVSDYTEASHSRSYVPKREYDNMFRYLFPPVIYGRRYADYILDGYRRKQ